MTSETKTYESLPSKNSKIQHTQKWDELQKILQCHLTDKDCPSTSDMEHALKLLKELRGLVEVNTITMMSVDDLQKPWKKLGEGHFGRVYEAVFRGSQVAIKLFKHEAEAQIKESNLLRYISHENIIAYRGYGYISSAEEEMETIQQENSEEMLRHESSLDDSGKGSITDTQQEYPKMFFVMEFLEVDLLQYVINMESHERHGLSSARTWDIAKQLTGALSYLHSLGIAHRDLKPDNVLVKASPNKLLVKIADFGLAWKDLDFKINPAKYGSAISGSTSDMINMRWGPPELREGGTNRSLQDYKQGDIYCLGLVILFTLSGTKPFAAIASDSISNYSMSSLVADEGISQTIDGLREGVLKKVLYVSLSPSANKRESADILYQNYFSGENPYQESAREGEMFSCGFMTKTEIFVADSVTSEHASQIGFYRSKDRPLGYDHEDLKCPIVTENAPYRDIENMWGREQDYTENYQEFMEQAMDKKIDNNPTVALKRITLSRPGEEEAQRIELFFKQSEYVHHRAMRKIWMSLSNQEKNKEIPDKGEVHPFFSNTFGLHVAILTNEGPDKPQQFVFPQRASRVGMSAPGAFTCGAVESASTPDIFEMKAGDKNKNIDDKSAGVNQEFKDTKFKVDLVNTAVRGLREELGIDLTGDDRQAVCLTTIYLKVDTHEWGLCGFVDLSDPRVKPENQLSAQNIRDMFTSGPKDKFEHKSLTFIPFELEAMVDFVSKNHEKFASSAKLVVVKVLQSFFGWSDVQQEFESRALYVREKSYTA